MWVKLTSYTWTCVWSWSGSHLLGDCAARTGAADIPQRNQCLYCHSVMRSDNSITVDDFPSELSPGDSSPSLTRGPVRRWIHLSLQISLLDQMVLFPIYIAGTVSSITAVSKICHQLVSITEIICYLSHFTAIYGCCSINTVHKNISEVKSSRFPSQVNAAQKWQQFNTFRIKCDASVLQDVITAVDLQFICINLIKIKSDRW